METWIGSHQLAKSITDEKLNARRERVKLEHINLSWLRPLARSLISLIF